MAKLYIYQSKVFDSKEYKFRWKQRLIKHKLSSATSDFLAPLLSIFGARIMITAEAQSLYSFLNYYSPSGPTGYSRYGHHSSRA
jgi:hypothetical protein